MRDNKAHVLQKSWEHPASSEGDDKYDKHDKFELKGLFCTVIHHSIKMDVIIPWPMKLQGFSFLREQKKENEQSFLVFRNFNEFRCFISDLSNNLGGSEKMTNRSSWLFSFPVSKINCLIFLRPAIPGHYTMDFSGSEQISWLMNKTDSSEHFLSSFFFMWRGGRRLK